MLIIHDVKVKLTCECGCVFTEAAPAAEKVIKAVCPMCEKEWPLYVKLEYKGYE